MDKRYRSLISNTIIFAAGTFGAKLILFFLLPLYTNVLTTKEYGVAELVMTFAELLIPFVSLSIGSSVLRFGLDEQNNKEIVLKNALSVLGCGSIVAIVLCPLLQLYTPISDYVFYLVAITILTALRTSLQYYTKASNKNIYFAIDGIIFAVLLATSNIIFLVALHKGINGYLYAQLCALFGSIMFLVISNKILSKFVAVKIDTQLMKEMLRFSIPLIINVISWWVIHSTDKVMIQEYLDSNDVGIYSAAAKIPSLLNTVAYFFSQAWVISAITEYDKNRDTHFYENVFTMYHSILCLVVSFFMIVLKPFMTIYIGPEFITSWHFVPFLLVAAVFRNYSDFFGAFFTSAKKNIAVSITTVIGAIANIVLNAILIPAIGIQGATIATMISYMLIGIYRQVASHKYMPIKVNIYRLVMNFILIIAEAVVLVVNRYIFVFTSICFLMIMIINWREIKHFIHYLINAFHNRRR